MPQEINVNAEVPVHALAQRLLQDQDFVRALVAAVRTALLQQARSTGDSLGGFAGTNSRDLQNLSSPVFQGHWDQFGVWVKN